MSYGTLDAGLIAERCDMKTGQASVAGPSALGWVVSSAVAMAAVALEHGATLHTTERDFARLGGLKWRNPLEGGKPRPPPGRGLSAGG